MKASGENPEEIGVRMKLARISLGHSQDAFSTLLGGSKRGIQNNESGKSIPGGEVIAGFIGLGINPVWLLTGEGEMLLADQHAKLVRVSQEVFGDAPKQLIPPQVEDVFKRLKDATDTAIKVGKELDYNSPDWIRLIQELIFSSDLTESGARRIIETLKQQT